MRERWPEAIIVGTGTDVVAHVGAEAQHWTEANNVGLPDEPSYDVIGNLNSPAERKNVAALSHIACRGKNRS